MIQTVVKRDGRIVGFNARKIGDAVRKAMVHTEAGENEELIHLICEHVANRGKVQMTVEEIQDAVEVELENFRIKTAKTLARKKEKVYLCHCSGALFASRPTE